VSDEHDRPPLCGWVKLWHPRGVLVTLPVPHGSAAGMLNEVTSMFDAGWLASAPGVEPGEETEEIGAAVKREKENRDKSTSLVMDLYAVNEAVQHPVLTIYLDSEADEAVFERATGLRLGGMPLYEGTNKIKRGENSKLDKKVCKCHRPAKVAFVPNPKYNEEEDKRHRAAGTVYGVPKRKFARWLDVPPPVPVPTGDEVQAAVTQWGDWLKTDPPVSEINKRLGNLVPMHADMKRRVWETLLRHAELANLGFESETKQFVVKAQKTPEPF
jgi:hypothetical protein